MGGKKMSSTTHSDVAVKCTENIAILHLLHPVPAQPSLNPITEIQSKEAGHSLPFDEERRLVSTLAFLAHIEDNPDYIPAVCLQEIPQKQSSNILLAVNRKCLSMKWREYASDIKEGFEGIAATIRHADDASRDIEREVFTLIIELCKNRILCRLRFTKKTRDSANKRRMTIADSLKRVVDYLHHNPSKTTKLFLEKAQNVLKLAVSWEKHQTPIALGALVDSVNSLRQTERYEDILGSVPNREVDVSIRSHLLNMTRKVSRYRESARILCRAARNFPQVRQMQVVVVELPNDAFNRPTINKGYSPNIHSTISRIPNMKVSLNDFRRMCNLLKISEEKANTQFEDQVKEALKNSKIHAEIQLLYYCQTMLQGKSLLPRVICSSKSACWLCNAFILFHGKIHMARSHGRLYPGWRLPNLPGKWGNDIVTRFNQYLEKMVIESLKTLHERKTRTNYPDPIESDLSTITWLSLSAQSESSSLLNSIGGDKKLEQLKADVINDASISAERVTTDSQGRAMSEGARPVEDAEPENLASSEDSVSESLTSVGSVALHTEAEACALSADTIQEPQEEARSYIIVSGEISPVYPLGPLKFQFEYARGRQQQVPSDNFGRQLSCRAEWLSSEDFEQLRLRGVIAVDIESLTGEEISHSTDTTNNIYLRHEEGIIRVTMQPV
ncbi:hypothetical protein F5Y12DRAFT_668422 [Xylaria sp. FL1777]|nr:hypothetical protein F5Y12DRAFT_668422 [Xylaria sp. FL1777]